MQKPIIIISFFCLLIGSLTSCVNTRKLQYMQGSFDTAELSKYTIPEPKIQQNDLLSIVVYSDNPAATAIYNQSQMSGGGSSSGGSGGGGGSEKGGASGGVSFSTSGSNPSSGGYLVDALGNIQFQGLGTVHVEGLTKNEVKALFEEKLKVFLQNPYCTVRFINYKITVIGDVARPAEYSIPAERVNLLEALGLAGDMNVTARRDNVLIIREQNGKREFGRIDLTRPDIFKSPFYELKQNDVIYVDLSKNKAALSDQTTIRNITLTTSIITAAVLIITVFKK